MGKKYKYVHVFWFPDIKFNPRVVELIYNPDNGFIPEDHLFVTPYENVYNNIVGIENVNKERILLVKNSLNLINKLDGMGDWIIIHSLYVRKVFFINKRCRKKIIWRTWGHDTGFVLYDETWFRSLIKKCLNYYFKKLVSDFRAIGIANIVDKCNIQRTLGVNLPLYVLGYPLSPLEQNDGTDKIQTSSCNMNDYKTEGIVNVLVGHSASSLDNHISIIKILKPFADKIRIFLILSYGGTEKNINKIKCFVENNCDNNITIIDKFMSPNEYRHFLDLMDIVILDAKMSYALGNVVVLLSKKKKIFLNEEGVLHQAFLSEGIPHCCTNEISKMSFDDFVKPLKISDESIKNLVPKQYKCHVALWHKLLDDLDRSSDKLSKE